MQILFYASFNIKHKAPGRNYEVWDQSSEIWRFINWQMGTNVSKEPAASIFIIVVSCHENVSNMFLRNLASLRLHRVISKKTIIRRYTAVRTSHLVVSGPNNRTSNPSSNPYWYFCRIFGAQRIFSQWCKVHYIITRFVS